MSWYTEYRQAWIAETLHVFGFINRTHLVAKFGISLAQASADINAFIKNNSTVLFYNKTTKRFEVISL